MGRRLFILVRVYPSTLSRILLNSILAVLLRDCMDESYRASEEDERRNVEFQTRLARIFANYDLCSNCVSHCCHSRVSRFDLVDAYLEHKPLREALSPWHRLSHLKEALADLVGHRTGASGRLPPEEVCAQLGPTGCTLPVGHRPAMCVTGLCSEFVWALSDEDLQQYKEAVRDYARFRRACATHLLRHARKVRQARRAGLRMTPRVTGGVPEPAADYGLRTVDGADLAALPRRPGPVPLSHSTIWQQLIEQTFGHQPMYLGVAGGDQLLDALPLFLVRVPMGGARLVSTPYQAIDGGFVSENGRARRALAAAVVDLGRKLGVRYVEVRERSSLPELMEVGFADQTPLLLSEIPLVSPDDNWSRLAPSHRRNVRMAVKKGVTIETASHREEIDLFYRYLLRHYQGLGVPFFGRRFLHSIWERLIPADHARLLLARHDGEIIGGMLLMFSGETLIVKYSVTRKSGEYAHVNASYVLYWEAVREGLARKLARVDLGITGLHHPGLRAFKKGFGAEEQPAHFHVLALHGGIRDYAGYYEAFRVARLVWRRLPAPLAEVIGSRINRWIC